MPPLHYYFDEPVILLLGWKHTALYNGTKDTSKGSLKDLVCQIYIGHLPIGMYYAAYKSLLVSYIRRIVLVAPLAKA